MSTSNSHLIIPISVGRTQAAMHDVAHALQEALHSSASQITVGNKVFRYAAFADREAVTQHLIQPGDRSYGIQEGQSLRTTSEDNSVWLAITSMNDPTNPAWLAQEALDADMLSVLNDQSSTKAKATEEALKSVAPDLSVRSALLQAVLFKAKSELDDALPRTPYEESVDLSNRGSYIGEVFNVDPVATFVTAPFELIDALREQNVDYIATTDGQAIEIALESVWDEEVVADITPALSALGYSAEDAETELRNFCEETLNHIGGSIDVKPYGKVAIDARLKLGKETAYITFDGITSSAYNAVPDESYMAMLDTLNIDVQSWVTHLAEQAGLATPKWDLDVQQFVDSFRHMANSDTATGIHWDSAVLQETMRGFMIKELFGTDGDPEEDANSATASYLFDIALEVMTQRAEELDEAWMRQNIPDFDNLPVIHSSKEWFERFPQIVQHPHYGMALANLGSTGYVSYEWSNPPHRTPQQPLISHSKLLGILENANYSGDLVIAFDMDLDDLSKLGNAIANNDEVQLRIDGAHFHIHDFMNGAGDGEELDAPFTITAKDLREGKWVLRNDTCTNYGIAGVFGEFTASDCSVRLERVAQAPQKAIETEPSLA